jgi:hypothetical protein
MGHRLLPFRQYDENDVVNLYALDASELSVDLQLMDPNDDDINADGVFVGIHKLQIDAQFTGVKCIQINNVVLVVLSKR